MEETKLALEWMRAKDAKKSWGEPLNGWRRHFKVSNRFRLRPLFASNRDPSWVEELAYPRSA
jgi:hypothetical protein